MINPNYKSHRDNAARVVQIDGIYYRYIFDSYKEDYDHLIDSGLYQKLINENLLIEHLEIDNDILDNSVYKKILPAQIKFQSYPFEWSYSQWRKAILAFLKINQIALKYGMFLKDATPYNFYLKAGNAILFDTSSFVKFKEGDPWTAYRQFCEEFFAPIALIRYNGQNWSQISKTFLHGIPLSFVSKQLPLKSWFNLTCFVHIHLNAKLENNKLQKDARVQHGYSIEKLKTLLDLFINTVIRWEAPIKFNNHWANYYTETVESEEYLKEKEKIVTEWIKEINPERVVDLGANTGNFSLIASKFADEVIAYENDYECVDHIQELITKNKIKNLTVVQGDLANPTPPLGIQNKEFGSIFDRMRGDLVLGLALTHHLFISNYMSWEQIAELFVKISSRYLIVEVIPIEDKKVQILWKGRANNFQSYHLANFQKIISKEFIFIYEIKINNSKRVLWLVKKITSVKV